MYKLKLDLPNTARGTEVEIDGLGVFKNGSEHIIDDELAETFRQRHQSTTFEYDKQGNLITTFEQGPTLLQALRTQKGFVVETYEPPKESSKEKPHEQQPAPKTAGAEGGDK